ncbi:uncharacterized protein LOC119666234 [Teleopsis dalmanni]|uniref:uncharacterized protein LOC119666234 n=1 Tax=Teleopsis dalmanni TaxID=139649 RepID=UPI0018CF8F5B|nr:uncharacterized protein LOC119666234 [Teleopsis dalmanni]
MPLDQRFNHVHLDLKILPECHGYRYALTMIDRFTRWPEVTPWKDIAVDTVVENFFATWISRFEFPKLVATNQGTQFESALFKGLANRLGTQRIRTSSYHPEPNGLIERFHRTLKTALMARAQHTWIQLLPSVLLGLRSSVKEDINTSAAEMVYGTTLHLPGEFFVETQRPPDEQKFLKTLCEHIRQFKPTPTSNHSNRSVFVHKTLDSASHIFIKTDHLRKPLEPPYTAPYKIIKRINHRLFTVDVRGNPVNLAIDRLKPAFFEPMVMEPNFIEVDVSGKPMKEEQLVRPRKKVTFDLKDPLENLCPLSNQQARPPV